MTVFTVKILKPSDLTLGMRQVFKLYKVYHLANNENVHFGLSALHNSISYSFNNILQEFQQIVDFVAHLNYFVAKTIQDIGWSFKNSIPNKV